MRPLVGIESEGVPADLSANIALEFKIILQYLDGLLRFREDLLALPLRHLFKWYS